MARPLRIEFSGALYHLTARGNAQQSIFIHDDDRANFLQLIENVCNRHHWHCHAYCLMSNHYHLLIETQQPTLSKGMKHLNGVYTQSFNRRHKRVGHVFQGRFKGILVESDAYLLELARYIVLNPVRAQMVRAAKDWPWSSYRATAGIGGAHPCLTVDWVLAGFGKQKKRAQMAYRAFVKEGRGQPSPWGQLKNQIYLGSDQFVEDMLCKLDPDQSLQDIPKPQKQSPPKPLSYYEGKHSVQKRAMAEAYCSGHYTLQQVGEHFGVSYATVSRAVRALERRA
ncbi:MAG: addiction module toxin RelE [Thiothrix sp.]|nr:MAG: addiction module toxin RelE [Thiothrix sp.]